MNTELSAQRQYTAIYRLRDMTVALYLISSDLFTYSLLHDIMRAAVVVFHVFMLVFSDTKQPMRPQLLWQSIFLIYFSFHTLLGCSISPSTSANQILLSLMNMMLLNMLICMIKSERGLRKFINLYTATMLAKTVIVLLLQRHELVTVRLGTTHFPLPVLGLVQYNANMLGMSAALCILLQLYLFDGNRGESWRLGFMAVNALVVLLSGSRKALMLAILFVFLFQFFNQPKYRLRNLVLTGLLGAAALFLVLNVESLYNVIGYRLINWMQSLFGGQLEESSAISRSNMFHSAVYWLGLRPFTGYGLDCFRYLAGSYGTYSHNNYMELMISGGIQVPFLYYWFYLYLLWQNLFRHKQERKLRALALCPILLLPVMESGWITYSSGLAMIFLALACSLQARSNDEMRSKERYVW